MMISTRNILLLSLGVSLAVTLALSVSYYSVVGHFLVEQHQVDSSRQVVTELRSLQTHTTRQFKEAAERIILGVEEADELEAARKQAEMSFDHLKELNAAEAIALAGHGMLDEEEEEEEEKKELLRMKAIYEDLVQHIESAVALEQAGDKEAAIKTLFAVTEDGFDDLLVPMIEAAIEKESQQVLRREARMGKAVSRLRLIAVVGGLVALCVIMLASCLILRSFQQIALAEKAAQATTQSKSEFLANMSHEIRTPMTAILGFTEVLLDPDCSNSDKLNAVHTIHRNGQYLLKIINNILDLSKIEASKMIVERTRCSPARIVSEVKSLMQVRADAKNLSFHIEYVGAMPETIESDPTRLKQVLINLISNAIKFTEVGVVLLVIRSVDDRDEPRLQFDVTDTGCGMMEEQVARLFQPFMQADSSTTRQSGGTGLGLTISKHFANLLGGDIEVVETEMDVGTTIRATVATGPLEGVRMLEDPMSATVVTDTATDVAQISLPALQGCRILLAEDGPDNQRLIAFVLRKVGADVTVEENGKLAYDAALAARDEGRAFDCILMDVQMPIMDGHEATRLLRRKGYKLPIIALTAHSMLDDRQKCIDAGCDDYSTKPIDREKLICMVARYTNQSEVAAETST